MLTLEKFNAVIDYVEEHILDNLDINHLASIAYCSAYDFQRTFAFASEISITEYIRKRRLTLAGLELQQSGIKVIDAALKYGYNSPVSFSRAFQAFHGFTPSYVKKSDMSLQLKSFPRIKFQIYVKEVNEMKIVEKDEIILIGCLAKQDAGSLWNEWDKKTETCEINHGITDDQGHSAAHEVRFYPNDGEYIFVGVEVSEISPDSEWEYLTVPAMTYAIFDIDQKFDQGSQFNAITEWIDANSDAYKRVIWDADKRVSASEFVICQYDHRLTGKYRNDRVMEMWIPIEKITE